MGYFHCCASCHENVLQDLSLMGLAKEKALLRYHWKMGVGGKLIDKLPSKLQFTSIQLDLDL